MKRKTRNNDVKKVKYSKKAERGSKGLLYKRVGNKKAKQLDRWSKILGRMS
jgi:hypothetical protein